MGSWGGERDGLKHIGTRPYLAGLAVVDAILEFIDFCDVVERDHVAGTFHHALSLPQSVSETVQTDTRREKAQP